MATIRDIAKAAGVSAGAVSRILNNDPTLSVTEETRSNVISIAGEMNYTKVSHAKSFFASGFTMGLVQWFSAEDARKDYYYLRARQGIEDFCVRNMINMVTVFHGDTDIASKLSGIGGLICLGKFSESEVASFIGICPNTVFLDMSVENYNITSLSMDFKGAVNKALDYLVSLGHTNIALLGGQEYVEDKPIVDPRTAYFKSYMEKHPELHPSIFEGSFNSESGYEMMKELLGKYYSSKGESSSKGSRKKDTNNKVSHPTAVFAASDAIALGAMRAAIDEDVSIPDEISIIGFNNEDSGAYFNPALTTINAPAYDMGQHGANLVFVASNLSIRTPLKALIPCTLIVRESCKSIL